MWRTTLISQTSVGRVRKLTVLLNDVLSTADELATTDEFSIADEFSVIGKFSITGLTKS